MQHSRTLELTTDDVALDGLSVCRAPLEGLSECCYDANMASNLWHLDSAQISLSI